MSTRERLRVATIVGTRPEIIRLSATVKRLDELTDHHLIHTGQNYDYELNEVFFEDLALRSPDHFLGVDTTSLGSVLGSVLTKTEVILSQVRPDAVLILGDTNSCVSALMARRMKIPVYHMEAGNRCFDENVPEEVNRRMVDHVADYNLAYTEHARRNLLAEGIHPSRIIVTGSPMREVLEGNMVAIESSDVLERQGLSAGKYLLASVHREENVDNSNRLIDVLSAISLVSENLSLPVLVSTHPRTQRKLDAVPDMLKRNLVFHPPFGFNDYVKLQQSARLVLSDSGTISEESSILGFPAVTLRDSIERPEALDTGTIITAGTQARSILNATKAILSDPTATAGDIPAEYRVVDTSSRVVRFMLSTAWSHKERNGIR